MKKTLCCLAVVAMRSAFATPSPVTVTPSSGSYFFQLRNAAGVALPMTSAAIPIIVQPGQAPPTVALTVTGVGLP